MEPNCLGQKGRILDRRSVAEVEFLRLLYELSLPLFSFGKHQAQPVATYESRATREGNYLSRHWRGELPLVVAFWINYIIVSVIYFAIGTIMESNDVGDNGGIPFMIILLPVIIWQCVGTWRSASNRRGFWGAAVKSCVAAGVLETVVGYAILIT